MNTAYLIREPKIWKNFTVEYADIGCVEYVEGTAKTYYYLEDGILKSQDSIPKHYTSFVNAKVHTSNEVSLKHTAFSNLECAIISKMQMINENKEKSLKKVQGYIKKINNNFQDYSEEDMMKIKELNPQFFI